VTRRKKKDGTWGRGTKKRGRGGRRRRRPTDTVHCSCGDVSTGYQHRDKCEYWTKLSNEERSDYLRAVCNK
jgi:hypothetical protein